MRALSLCIFALATAGAIACNINSDSSNTTTAPLAGPSITQQPANVSVAVGQAATFTVAASGTTPLAYQWSRNGVPILNATGTSYTVLNAAKSDSGARFFVAVSNALGSVTSNAALLTVTSP